MRDVKYGEFKSLTVVQLEQFFRQQGNGVLDTLVFDGGNAMPSTLTDFIRRLKALVMGTSLTDAKRGKGGKGGKRTEVASTSNTAGATASATTGATTGGSNARTYFKVIPISC